MWQEDGVLEAEVSEAVVVAVVEVEADQEVGDYQDQVHLDLKVQVQKRTSFSFLLLLYQSWFISGSYPKQSWGSSRSSTSYPKQSPGSSSSGIFLLWCYELVSIQALVFMIDTTIFICVKYVFDTMYEICDIIYWSD